MNGSSVGVVAPAASFSTRLWSPIDDVEVARPVHCRTGLVMMLVSRTRSPSSCEAMLPYALIVATTASLGLAPVLLVPLGPDCGALLLLHATAPSSTVAVPTAAHIVSRRCHAVRRPPVAA